MSSDDDAYSAVEHARVNAENTTATTLERRIDEALEKCGQLLSTRTDRAYAALVKLLVDDVIPDVNKLADADIGTYSHLSGVDVSAVVTVRDEPERLLTELLQGGGSAAGTRQQIERAVSSLEEIAAAESVVLDEYSGRVDAVGFETQLGIHLQNREMDIGDPVRLVTEQSGALKTLYSGGTGNGKSVCLEAEALDYYRRNESGNRDFKIIDPAGLRDGENWLYDIPQQDPDLQQARAEFDLPETFVESEFRQPDIEILVPLTEALQSQQLPYDVDEEKFTVRPFTIPAADIRKELLVSILTAKLTPEQESVIRDAYSSVNDRRSNWALRDLAEEIRARDELKPAKRKPAIRTLRQLQNRGFIRTRDCEHSLDWRSMFKETDTYTVFSQSFLDSTIAQLIVFGYLTNSIVKKRERMHDVPEAVLVMRELWKIAPHQRRQEFDERAAQLQEAIGQMFARLFRDNRHSAIHVLADTQQPSDLLKPVREMFNRYVIFRTDKRTVRDIFEWTSNDNWQAFYNTLTPKAGEASIVGMTEPAVEERGIQFVGPVRYAPASHHHKMERVDATGWHARTQYFSPLEQCPECESDDVGHSDDGFHVVCTECGAETTDYSGGRDEVLRSPGEMDVDWQFELPTKLLMEEKTSGDGKSDVATQPVAAFAERCLQYDTTSSIRRSHVKRVFNHFIVQHEDANRSEGWDFDANGVSERFGKRLSQAFDGKIGGTTKGGDWAWNNLKFTDVGSRFADEVIGDEL